MRNVTRPWQGGAATGRLERLSQTSGPEQKRTCRPWCGRPSMLWGKLPSLSTPLGARAGSREPARAYPGCAEPARRDNAVCVNAGELAKGSSRGVRRARSSGDAPGTFLTGYVSTSPVAVSVRIEPHSKRRFDRIRAELGSALGRDVTLSEFFEVLADVADEQRERLMARAAGVGRVRKDRSIQGTRTSAIAGSYSRPRRSQGITMISGGISPAAISLAAASSTPRSSHWASVA